MGRRNIDVKVREGEKEKGRRRVYTSFLSSANTMEEKERIEGVKEGRGRYKGKERDDKGERRKRGRRKEGERMRVYTSFLSSS